MVTRQHVVTLIIILFAISSVGVAVATAAPEDPDRPETGQAPNSTSTTGASTQTPTTGQSAAEVTYRVTMAGESDGNHTELSQYGEVGTIVGTNAEVTLTRANAVRITDLNWVQSVVPVQETTSFNTSSSTHNRLHTTARQAISATGDGVDIGIIDSGFDTADPAIASQIASSRSFREVRGNPSHGTNVAESVLSVAPESSLHLASVRTGVDAEAAISALVEQDVDVIVMSIGYARDDTGNHFLTDDVDMARSEGSLMIVAAGNYGQAHWEGEYQSADGDVFHEWVPGDERNCIPNCQTPFSGQLALQLEWDDDGDGSQYRLIAYNPVAEEVIGVSFVRNRGGTTAFLSQNIATQPVDLIVEHVEGPADDRIEVTAYTSPSIQHAVGASSLSSPADVPSVVSVAAYEPNRERIAPYSSQGPTDTGERGVDIAGLTNLPLSNGVFRGTSASAPYVAGVAALVQETSTDELTPNEIEAALTQTATDIGIPGPDPISGAGVVNPDSAVASVAPEDDRFEPNDTREAATRIEPGMYQDLQLTREDTDLFAIELAAGMSLSATTAFSHDTGDLTLRILEPGGAPQAVSDTMTNNETAQIERAATAGTYYVAVAGATDEAAAGYDLTVTTSEPQPAASVKLAEQTTNGETVNISEVTLPNGGFVTIHDRSLRAGATFDSVRGTSVYLPAGTHANLSVTLDHPYDRNGTMIAMLHRDTNDNQQYDFVTSTGAVDDPYTTADDVTITDTAALTIAESVGIGAPPTVGPVAPGETVNVTYEYTNLGTDAGAGRIELQTANNLTATAIGGDGTSGLGGTPQSILYGFTGPIAGGETKTTTVTFEVGEETSAGNHQLTATAYVAGTTQTATRSTAVVVTEDVVAQFDTNGEDGIQPVEAQTALVALNNGEISPQAAQQIIVELNSS